MPRRRLLAIGIVLLTIAGCDDDSDSGPTTTPGTVASEQFDMEAARAYCDDEGGDVEVRQAYWGTNLERSSWVALAETIELCRFEAEDGSRIYLDLETLYADQPTLAAAAYLAKIPLPTQTGGANPAAIDCATTLQGTASWGTASAGGGWVHDGDQELPVVDLCLFSDRSGIDQWGIAYYSEGIVRGKDLAEVFRFDVADVPPFFAQPAGD